MRIIVALLLFIVTCSSSMSADFALAPLFRDYAVLQMEKPVIIWGKGTAGDNVELSFAGQKKETIVSDEGTWFITLEPMKANSTEEDMVVKSAEQIIVVRHVLIGEVWLCSGQSNMDYDLYSFIGSYKNKKDEKSLVEHYINNIKPAQNPTIRQFGVKKLLSPDGVQQKIIGSWMPYIEGQNYWHFSATAYFFAKELNKRLGVPVGIIKSAVSGTPIVAWTSKETLKKYEYGKKAIGSVSDADKAKNGYPSSLFNGMIYPIAPYTIRGVVWYQGEGEGVKGKKHYYDALPALINDWRSLWDDQNLPFYYVQLPNWKGYFPNEPGTASYQKPGISSLAVVRDAQFKTLSLPHTSMAITIDIGDINDVHPINKIDVGKRLALLAIHDLANNKLEQEYTGPLFQSMEIVGNKIVLAFNHVGKGLMAGQKKSYWENPEKTEQNPGYFQICGIDKNWVWAKATITAANTVAVWSDTVINPVAVRYCWFDAPGKLPLLYNSDLLPASPFRTDDY